MKAQILIIVFILNGCALLAQTPQESKLPIKISAYLETYYAFQNTQPEDHQLPLFLYSHNRHNEITPNLALFQFEYAQARTRAKIGLMAGTYANANLVAEPGVLKNIFEANVGYRLSTQEALWLDVGVFASHIGFESAIGADCWTLSRSLGAENSPYYNSGLRLSYHSSDGHWYAAVLIMNGWQRIQRARGVQMPALGHQLTYTFGERLVMNSSSFVGQDNPGHLRLFHNFYTQIGLSETWSLILGFDIGAEQIDAGVNEYALWYTPVGILRWEPKKRLGLALRVEYFADPDNILFYVGPSGLQASSASLNLDYQLSPALLWRIEGRWLSNIDPIFEAGGSSLRQTTIIYSSLAFSFGSD